MDGESEGGFAAPEVDIDVDNLQTPNLFSVAGKNVFVTGGARGIGLMIAAGFALNGARVAISSRDGAAGERAVVRLNEIGVGGCFSVPGDLSKREEIDRVLAVVEEEFGGQLHVLVNNSGAAGGSRIDSKCCSLALLAGWGDSRHEAATAQIMTWMSGTPRSTST